MRYSETDLQNDLLKGLKASSTLLGLAEYLKSFKMDGGKQNDAHRILEELRVHFKGQESIENKVLELLDLVVGHCTPAMRIWDLYD